MTGFSRKMRVDEAARYVGLAASTLAKMRVRGDGPRYAKAGKRICVYDQIDLEDWIRSGARRSTSARSSPTECN